MTLKALLERFAQQLGQGLYISLSERMKDVGKDYIDRGPSAYGGLQIRTGGLLRSFLPGAKEGLFSYSASDSGLKVVFGSRRIYAKIHETGGIIRAKKMKQTKRGLIPNMALYFLARYKQTKEPYFRNLFLAVKEKGFVTIPQRKYFSEAVQDFGRTKFPRLLGVFVQNLLREYVNREAFGTNE